MPRTSPCGCRGCGSSPATPGWAPGQLEEELAEGAWWVVEGSPLDLFSDDPRPLWPRVLRRQPPPLSLVSTYPPDPTLN